MNRWMMGTAITASLLYPPQASAQYPQQTSAQSDTAKLKCEITGHGSVATIENVNTKKASSICRWKCVYRTYPGPPHINQGARKLRAGETKTFKTAGTALWYLTDIGYSCP